MAEEISVDFFRFQQLKVGTGILLPIEESKSLKRNSLVCFDRMALVVLIRDKGLVWASARNLMNDISTAKGKGHIQSAWNTISLQKSFTSIKPSCCQNYLLASCKNQIFIFKIKDLVQVFMSFLL
jgi:hypothetical protein